MTIKLIENLIKDNPTILTSIYVLGQGQNGRTTSIKLTARMQVNELIEIHRLDAEMINCPDVDVLKDFLKDNAIRVFYKEYTLL